MSTISERFAGLLAEIKSFFQSYWWALLLGVILLAWFVVYRNSLEDLPANIFSELFGILITIIVIDLLSKASTEKQRNEELFLQLQSPYSGFALEAARLLHVKGQLRKGILKKRLIDRADLRKVELPHADLTGTKINLCNFSEANFNGAILANTRIYDSIFPATFFHKASFKNSAIFLTTNNNFIFRNCSFRNADFTGLVFWNMINGKMVEEAYFQLLAAGSMRGAILPNGSRYDGRFNLEHDSPRTSNGGEKIDVKFMAEFYGVSEEQYLLGQEWAVQNNIAEFKQLISQTKTHPMELPIGTIVDLPHISDIA